MNDHNCMITFIQNVQNELLWQQSVCQWWLRERRQKARR